MWEPTSNPAKAVDGTASPRSHPNEFHIGGGDCDNLNAWWMVDLGKEYPVNKIVYWGR